jgi:CheY-like chemotaxis protein
MMKGEPIVILHVEDEPAHATVVQRIFEDFRIANRLMQVSDGQAALDYLQRSGEFSAPESSPRPSVVLLDLRLPKVDGLEVLRTVKADPDLCLIPVVILTTSDAETDMVQAYGCMANSYLVKPVDLQQFVDMMEAFGYYWLVWNGNPY